MADLRIVDAPLLSTVKGTEKIPTGGEGNFSVSVNQVADFAKLKWVLATEGYVDNAVGNVQADLNLHKNNESNPHNVTKTQFGLGNVDNTADLDKPISNATQSAIITANSGKADKSYVDSQDQLKADKVDTYTKNEVYTKSETELLVTPKADKSYVDTALASFTNGASKFYPTLALANADIANITIKDKVEIGEVLNGGTWYKATADATSLTKSPYDAVVQSKTYMDVEVESLRKSKISKSEFAIYSSNLANLLNATRDKTIRADGTVTDSVGFAHSDYIEISPNSNYYQDGFRAVVFYDKNKNFISRSLYGVVSGKVSATFTTPSNSYFIHLVYSYASAEYNGLGFKLNSGAVSLPYEPFYIKISPDVSLGVATTYFSSNSQVYSEPSFNADKVFEDIEFWGLEDTETVYLRTLWNYYYLAAQSKYTNSVGFNSSLGVHIAIGIAPQSNISLYSTFDVTVRNTDTVDYLLYRNGDVNTESIGRVRINWNEVKNATTQRYIKTDNSIPLDMVNVRNVASQEVLNIAKDLPNTSQLSGKKIGAIGDSITWGFTPRNDPNGGVSGAQLNSWLVLAAQKLGMTAYNYGISGSTLGAIDATNTRNPFVRRYQSMDDSLDVICVMGGTNDVRNGVPIGLMSDRVDTTYYGALHVMCKGLIDKYYINHGTELGKSKQIILMTPIKLQVGGGTALDTALEPYVQAVKDVGAYYSIPVFDTYNLSGITPHISQTVQGTEAGYTQMYNIYITDGTHPTQQGHVKMANVVSGFLKTLS